MKFLLRALLVAGLLSSSMVMADTVLLKNGDRVTGTINAVNPTTVDITTPYAGKISIVRDNVKMLASDAPVNISTTDGQTHQAFVGSNADGTAWVESPAKVVVAAPATPPAVAAVPVPPAGAENPAAAPAPEQKDRWFPPVGPHWKNELTLGYENRSGNDDLSNFSAGLDLHYQLRPNELELKFSALYSVDNGTQTSGLAAFDGIYRRELSERWYLFAEDHTLYDGIKEISLRTINTIGPGYYLWRGQRLEVDVRGGPGITYEKLFGSTPHTDLTAMAGLRASYKFNERVNATEEALYNVSLFNADRYQITSETALNVKLDIQRGLGLKLAFDDDYDNDAAAGTKQNDTRTIVALTFDF